MTNVETKAAGFNYFTFDTLPIEYQKSLEQKLLNKWFNDNFKEVQNLINTLSKDIKDTFEIGIFIEAKKDTYDDKIHYYVESHLNIFLMQKGSGILCKLMTNKKKYYLHPLYEQYAIKYNQLSQTARQEIRNRLSSPNLIGVFSAKKLSDWVTYCENYIILVNNAFDVANNKVTESKDFVKNYIEQIKPYITKSYIYEYDIYVKTSLFEVQFKIDKHTGYLSQQVNYIGHLNNVLEILIKNLK